MLWTKAWHVIFMVTYFAGVFYLPRLFVYHAQIPTTDKPGIARFKIMEHKLFWWIMTPSLLLMSLAGIMLLWGYAWQAYKTAGWLHTKLLLVAVLWGYHFACWYFLRQFAHNRNLRSHVFYRYFNEIPSVILIATVILVIVKPF